MKFLRLVGACTFTMGACNATAWAIWAPESHYMGIMTAIAGALIYLAVEMEDL